MNIVVCTTFGNQHFDVYARQMLQSYAQYWPKDIRLLVQLDDDLLVPDVDKILRPQDAMVVGHDEQHAAFIERNKGKDDPTNYRKQPVRFCHKVFAIHRTLQAVNDAKSAGAKDTPRYIIWMDADVVTTKPVTMEDIKKCLPKEGDAVAYLGRKDWEHSECGWLAFDLQNCGDDIIKKLYSEYVTDSVLAMSQQHDSWVFDRILEDYSELATNLTKDKPGMEIWPQSPMAAWSIHYKGPAAKQKLIPQQLQPRQGQNFIVQTKNAIPNEQICKHISENQKLIKNWVQECELNNETIVVVSAGPLLVAEDVKAEIKAGRKIVAVKHALKPLKAAGIKPWACILLDPRPHVADFVTAADTDVIWLVASQVNPKVTKALLKRGCTVWGYHASVGAGEEYLTRKQPYSIVGGGSATATRGLFLLRHLGFENFRLYGYDLSYPDKPDLNARDDMGQPKYLEFSVGTKNPYVDMKRNFYSEPQLIAQFEELNDIIKTGKLNIEAFGDGMVPFIIKLMNLTRLRQDAEKCIMGRKLSSYKRLFKWQKTTRLSRILPRILPKTRHKQKASRN